MLQCSSSRKRKNYGQISISTVLVSGGTHEEEEAEFQTESGTQQSFYSTESITQQSVYSTQAVTQQSQPYGPKVGIDEDPLLRPKIFSKTMTRLKERMTKAKPPIGSRRIIFTRDANGVSIPSGLPFSPTKTTLKGKAVMTSKQLQDEGRKKKFKIIDRKGKGVPTDESIDEEGFED